MFDYIDFTQTQTLQLVTMLKKMKEQNDELRFCYVFDTQQENQDPRNPQIECLIVQTPMMRRNYKQFSDVVFMDATYNTNQMNLALAIVNGISAEGKNMILAFALMNHESAANYTFFLKKLTEMNDGLEPKCIMTDFDASMCAAIESVYSPKTTHLLCQWHMMQNFKKHFVYLSKRKACASKMLYNHIIDSIYTDQPKKFIELQDLIFEQGVDMMDPSKIEYLRKLF